MGPSPTERCPECGKPINRCVCDSVHNDEEEDDEHNNPGWDQEDDYGDGD